jgi:hypothetical protein
LETGVPISRTSPGTYFFFAALFMQIEPSGLKQLLTTHAVTSSLSSRTLYFELLHTLNGTVVVLAFVTAETGARLAAAAGSSIEATLSPAAWGQFETIALLPIDRIESATPREIDLSAARSGYVLDVTIR